MSKYLANILSLIGSGSGAADTSVFNTYTEKLMSLVTGLLTPIFAVLATVGIVWIIVLSVNYMKAESTDKKEEAKKRIINVVIGTVIMIVMVILLLLVANNIDAIVGFITSNAN